MHKDPIKKAFESIDTAVEGIQSASEREAAQQLLLLLQDFLRACYLQEATMDNLKKIYGSKELLSVICNPAEDIIP